VKRRRRNLQGPKERSRVGLHRSDWEKNKKKDAVGKIEKKKEKGF